MKRTLPQEVQREESDRNRQRIQRKRMKQIRRRKRIRRIFTVFTVLIMGVVLIPPILLGVIDWVKEKNLNQSEIHYENGKIAAGNTKEDVSASVLPQGNVDAVLLSKLKSMYEGDKEAKEILEHPENYPDALLELLAKRPETLDFVREYPKKQGKEVSFSLKKEIQKGEIPLLYQWDQRWGYHGYGDSIIALAGCGPTCLSMVALGLTGDATLNPVYVADYSQAKGYITSAGTSWDLMTLGAEELGLESEVLPLDENRMKQALLDGRPIICSMRPGDFTDTGHFIVLTDYKNGGFTVNDPNSIDNSKKVWTFEDIKGQIKNLWAFAER